MSARVQPQKDIQGLSENLQWLQESLRGTIVSALKRNYTSVSSHMDYKTGNNYQSVNIGDHVESGYRADRSRLFEAFNLSGRSVLDCGSNLGEMSRLARARGATLVDGYEYDPFFVKIGQTVNAHNGVSRVSFYERDLTDPSIYVDTFDITLAFSVYPYVTPVLAEIAARTREALIVETHDMIDLHERYVVPLSRYFPAHSFVASTDYGFGEGRRAVFIFAKEDRYLTPGYGLFDSSIHMEGARFGFIDPLFSLSNYDSTIESKRLAIRRLIDLHAAENLSDLSKFTASKAYWFQMMKGYLEYASGGIVTRENSYFKALHEIMASVNFDHNLSREMGTDDAIISRVTLRFADVDRILDGPEGVRRLAPIRIVNHVHDAGTYMMHTGRFGEKIFCDDLDGYHRVFWARLLKIPQLPALFVSQR